MDATKYKWAGNNEEDEYFGDFDYFEDFPSLSDSNEEDA